MTEKKSGRGGARPNSGGARPGAGRKPASPAGKREEHVISLFNPPRYDSFDYARPVSGTYGDAFPETSPDWKYLISTVDSYVIGNLSSDFTLGATFPFPTVIPDADYGNSIKVGYVVPYSLYAADLSNAVIHLE